LDATKAFTITCKDKEEVAGLPPSALELGSTRYNDDVKKKNKECVEGTEQVVEGNAEVLC